MLGQGGGLQAVGASSDRRSHGKVWRTKKTTPPARPPQAWWKSLQPMSLVAKSIPAVRCAITSMCAGGAGKRRSTGRQINTARGTDGWQRYTRYGPGLNNHARRK
ncbi:exo-alpha-sialidase, partial [Trypanosoma cruzi]